MTSLYPMSNDIQLIGTDDIFTDEEGDYMWEHAVKLTVEVYTLSVEYEEETCEIKSKLGSKLPLSFTVQHGGGTHFGSRDYITRAVRDGNATFDLFKDQFYEDEDGIWNYDESEIRLYTIGSYFKKPEDHPWHLAKAPTCFGEWLCNESRNQIRFFTRPGGIAEKLKMSDSDLDLLIPFTASWRTWKSKVRLPSE